MATRDELAPKNRSGAPHSSTLMWASLGADHRLEGPKERLEADHVGPGAVESDEDFSIVTEVLLEQLALHVAVTRIVTVGRDMVAIGFDDGARTSGWTPAQLSLANELAQAGTVSGQRRARPIRGSFITVLRHRANGL